MIQKHNERLNPESKNPKMNLDQVLHFIRIQNATLGGTETIK